MSQRRFWLSKESRKGHTCKGRAKMMSPVVSGPKVVSLERSYCTVLNLWKSCDTGRVGCWLPEALGITTRILFHLCLHIGGRFWSRYATHAAYATKIQSILLFLHKWTISDVAIVVVHRWVWQVVESLLQLLNCKRAVLCERWWSELVHNVGTENFPSHQVASLASKIILWSLTSILLARRTALR